MGSTPTAPKILWKEIWIEEAWIRQADYIRAVGILFLARRIANELGYERTESYKSPESMHQVIKLKVPHLKKKPRPIHLGILTKVYVPEKLTAVVYGPEDYSYIDLSRNVVTVGEYEKWTNQEQLLGNALAEGRFLMEVNGEYV